ncbi:MAG: winged helix-turn-helix domain-containing protein [Roseburia sp.]|nr:winged helix-turn-helix domain-containing protein [Roseburia sp.]
MFTISAKINEISEGLALLKHLGAGEKYADLQESLGKKYALSSLESGQKFALLERIEQNAENVFREKMDEIRYYFAVVSSSRTDNAEIGCAGMLALLWETGMDLKIEDTAGLRSYLAGLSEEDYCRRFGELLYNYTRLIQMQEDTPQNAFKEPFAIIQYLMQMDIDEEEKWKIQKIFCDKETHRQNVLALLEQAVAILHSFQEEIAELSGLFYQYWSETLKEHSLSELLSENKMLKIPENSLGVHIRPSVILPNVIALCMNTDVSGNSDRKPDYFKFGILFGEDFPLNTLYTPQSDTYETFVTQALKLLSDKSKFEILSYIRDKSAYGSELARHLNLTTATVSHHMNALLSSGLVRLQCVGNRVYYISNKDALEELLHYCEQVLVKRDD